MMIDPVSSLFGLATFVAVLALGFVLSAQNNRMAASLKQLNKTMADWLMIQVKDRREAKLAQVNIENPLDWVTRQCGVTVSQVQRVVEAGCAVDMLSPDGMRVVVSTLEKDELLKVIAPMAKGVGGQLVEPLLGRSSKKVEPIVRDLTNAGECFDFEAGQVGQMLQMNWGQPARLYFYLVPLK